MLVVVLVTYTGYVVRSKKQLLSQPQLDKTVATNQLVKFIAS